MRSGNAVQQLLGKGRMSGIQIESGSPMTRPSSGARRWVARSSVLTMALASAYAAPGAAWAADEPAPAVAPAASAPAVATPAPAPAPAAAASTAPLSAARPAPQADDSDQIQTVVVVARRIAEPMQEIPASIAAVTGDKIANMGTLADIQSLVSGVTFKTFGPIPTVGIRGFGNRTVNGNNANSTVGIFQDGVYVAPPLVIDASRIDTERVEVAKGPQDTLYGRASFTGAINIVSNDPASTLGGYVDAGYGGSSVHSEELWHARAAISIPIDDKLSVRFFGLREKRDGYTYDSDTGNRGDGYDRKIARVKFLWEPTDDITARLTGTVLTDNLPLGMDHTGRTPAPYGNNVFLADTVATATYTPPVPTFGKNVWDATGSYVVPPSGKTKGQQLTLDLRVQTGLGEIQSLTDTQHSTQDLYTSLDLTSANVAFGQGPFEERRWSEELRLSNKIGAVSYQFGAYYLLARNEQSGGNGPDLAHPSITLGPDAAVTRGPANITALFTPSTLKTAAHAVFGQVGYDFTKALNLTVGLRRGRDGLSGSTGSFAQTAFGLVSQQAMTYRSEGFDSTTGSANLSYKFAPEVVGYVSYAKGDSPGGFNGGVLANDNFNPQKVDAYEMGLKSQMLDRHLQVNVALFDNQYKDLQITQNQIVNGQFASFISNAGDAHGRGLDLDATAVLSKDWRLGLQYTYVQSKITHYELAAHAVPLDFTGVPLVRSPKDSVNGSVTYLQAIGAGKLSLTADESYTSSYTNDYQGVPANQMLGTTQKLALYRTPGYATTNVNGSYGWGSWEVSGFVRNLFNRQYIASVLAFDATSYPEELPGEPRTYELSLKYKF